MLPLAIVGLHSKGVTKEGATGSADEVADEVGALEIAQDNPHSSAGTPTIYVISSDRFSKEEEGANLVRKNSWASSQRSDTSPPRKKKKRLVKESQLHESQAREATWVIIEDMLLMP